MFFFVLEPVEGLEAFQTSPGPLDGPGMFLGHCGLVRDCVWSSGDALATLGGRRRRLLQLKIMDFHRFPLVFIDFH